MSVDVTLVVVGVVLCVIGLSMLGSRQSGGLSLRNFGLNFFSTSNQTNTAGDAAGDWVGLAIAVIGFFTAAVGLFKH